MTSNPYIVSRYYRAPELLLGKKDYNYKIDIFSAGCIIAELFILSPLFPGQEEWLQLFEQMTILGNPGSEYFKSFEKILNKENKYSDEDAKNASDLILNMLNFDYDKRYSAEISLNHPFFTKSDK